jgi:hypothetical protein
VTPLGLDKSNRPEKDGHVYLGTLVHSLPDSKGNIQVLNDFILPPFLPTLKT